MNMNVITVIREEFKTITHSYAILLVLMGGIFVYGLLYNYMYAPNVVRKVPVVVVDHSRSELSRRYTRLLDATPQVGVTATAADYTEAREMIKMGRAAGILYLPDDFEDRVSRGEQSVFVMYETTITFLYYLSIEEASAGSMLALNEGYRPEMLVFLPQQAAPKLASAQPITVVGTILYNPTEGYGTYLIPAVLIVIIFQILMMLIGTISGGERHSGTIVRYAGSPLKLSFGQMANVVIGKTFTYSMLYVVFTLFLLGLLPLAFGLPDLGSHLHIIMLMIPFLMATSFFGLTASLFFTDSEMPPLMIPFFSVGLLFLSGISYPMELMPWYWQLAHYLIPAAPATMAYVKLTSMGASMGEIGHEYITLWVQCAVYFVAACWVYRYNIRKAIKGKTRVTMVAKNASASCS
ncbi:ABC transporter permease [Parabacteroides sp.]